MTEQELDDLLFFGSEFVERQLERAKKQQAAQYHLQEYQRITQELEAS